MWKILDIESLRNLIKISFSFVANEGEIFGNQYNLHITIPSLPVTNIRKLDFSDIQAEKKMYNLS